MAMTLSVRLREWAGKLVGTDDAMRVHPLTWYRDDAANPVDMRMDDFMNVVLQERRSTNSVKES